MQAIKGENKVRFVFPSGEDNGPFGFDAVLAHLLTPKSKLMLEEHLGKQFYVRIPAYDYFVAFNDELYKSSWESIRDEALTEFKNSKYPVSNKLFLYTNGKLITTNENGPKNPDSEPKN